MPTGAEASIQEAYEKALSELTLLIDPSCYSYISGATNVKGAWEALKNAFSDSGVCRKVSILQQFVSTKFSDCGSMQEYVNRVTILWGKVKSVGFTIDEEVAASLMLGGLPSEYKPMVLGVENSKDKLTVDYVKTLLLQEIIVDIHGESSENAMAAKHKNKHFKKSFVKKNIKCFICGEAHFAKKLSKEEKQS